MTYRGVVKSGAIVLTEPAALREGAEVRIEIIEAVTSRGDKGTPSLAERFATIIGKADGMPEDWSERHDDYLRQQPGP